ncbi:MAG TPA: DUF1501 domain-containing protein [Bryobacteraceae bacterium]|nr:DUF1501 domain-containing protein [Bryobacteraceae bacterium]
MNFDESRRNFLYQNLTGVGGAALLELLGRDLKGAARLEENPLAPKTPHHQAKAKSCIFLTMLGGVSHVDTFDPKPALKKFDGTSIDWSKEKTTDQPALFAKPRVITNSPFAFQKHGQCGMEISEIFPHLANCVDDIAVVRSAQAENGNHPAAVFQIDTGFVQPGSPSVGAWLTYGLGTENQNLPAFVALPDFRSIPFSGAQQWGSGFLPASYQGTVLRWKGEAIRNLRPPGGLSEAAQQSERELLRSLNQVFLHDHFANPDLQARIDSYELSYRMQTEVPAVLNIDQEPASIREMYGLNDPVTESFGKRCLMARKLVEHGVRYVQLYTPSQSWDAHIDIRKNHLKNAQETDKPAAALIQDLKQRGLLSSTLLVWMGEFGRTPDTPADQKTKGRDHNPKAMSVWFAGGGIKGGTVVGATDELGLKAVQDVYRIRDVHATILDLMGLNDMRLTYYFAGRNRRLTDTGGKRIAQVMA